MSYEGPQPTEFRILCADEAPGVYQGRAFWESAFRRKGVWPVMLEGDEAYVKYSVQVDKLFKPFQLVAVLRAETNRVAGIANTVPIQLPQGSLKLPEEGWDWALERSITGRLTALRPDALCGLSITVLPEYRGKGLGSALIRAVISMSADHRLHAAVMPVRPVLKQRFPFMSMTEFLNLRRVDGFHEDPWIRAHERLGGAIGSVCSRSMTVDATIERWEGWLGRQISNSGDIVVPGALVPVTVNIAEGRASYREPNVWISHLCNNVCT